MHYSSTGRVTVKEDPGQPAGANGNTSRPYYLRPADHITGPDCQTIRTAYLQTQAGQGGVNRCSNSCGNFHRNFIGAPGDWPLNKTITTTTVNSWPNVATAVVGQLRPYDVVSESGNYAYPLCRNTEEAVASPPGSEATNLTIHSHRIEKEIGDTNYEATTEVETIRPDALQASVNIRTDTDTKFDDIVSPYIVMEFLIKY